MSPRGTGHTREMSTSEVRSRAAAARQFLEVAQLVIGDDHADEYRQVSAALAVLAGIAAADAVCGHLLGHCSRGQDHRQATDLLRRTREGASVAGSLDKLLDIKDAAHYGAAAMSADRVRGALRAASTLVEHMDRTLRPR